jgi:hypothetical protein
MFKERSREFRPLDGHSHHLISGAGELQWGVLALKKLAFLAVRGWMPVFRVTLAVARGQGQDRRPGKILYCTRIPAKTAIPAKPPHFTYLHFEVKTYVIK